MNLPASLINAFEILSHQSDEAFDMFECALLASKILQPSANIDHYRPIIIKLSTALQVEYECKIQNTSPVNAKVQALQKVLCHDHGFRGDEDAFDDLEHLNIFSLLDHKYGTQLSLSILFLQCARLCGWSVHSLNFPGLCLIRIDEGAERVILDPFNGCAELKAYDLRQFLKVIAGGEAELKPIYSESLAPKSVSLRHLNAMKLHFLRCQQMGQALEILQALTILKPTSAAFWRETGLLQARLNHIDDAITSLEIALKFTSDSDTIRHTEHILNDLIKKSLD